MAAPTYPSQVHLAEGTGNRSFAAVTTTAGDWIVIDVVGEDAALANVTPSVAGVTFTNQNNGGAANHCRVQHWTGQDTAGASRTVLMTASVSGRNYRATLTVVRGSQGPGTGKAVNTTAQTASITRQGANSGVFMAMGDWNTGAVGSPVWTPGGTTQASQQGSAATYVIGRWNDSGSTGTAAHGISSPFYTTPAIAVLEMLGSAGISGNVGMVSTTDVARPIGKAKAKAIGMVIDTSVSRPVTHTKSKALGQAVQTDLARRQVKVLGRPTDTSVSRPFTKSKSKTLGLVTQANFGLSLTRTKTRTLGLNTDTSVSRPMAKTKSKGINRVTEVDSALVMTPQFPASGVVGRVTETDVSQSMGKVKTKTILLVTEADVSRPMARTKSKLIGFAVEFNVSRTLNVIKAKGVIRVTETDLSRAMSRLKAKTIGRATEVDLAQLLTRLGMVGRATETDIARAIDVSGGEPPVPDVIVRGPFSEVILVRGDAVRVIARPTPLIVVARP